MKGQIHGFDSPSDRHASSGIAQDDKAIGYRMYLQLGSTFKLAHAMRQRSRSLTTAPQNAQTRRALGTPRSVSPKARPRSSGWRVEEETATDFPVIRCVRKICFMVSPETRSQNSAWQFQRLRMPTNRHAMRYADDVSSSRREKGRVRNGSRRRAFARAPMPNAVRQS